MLTCSSMNQDSDDDNYFPYTECAHSVVKITVPQRSVKVLKHDHKIKICSYEELKKFSTYMADDLVEIYPFLFVDDACINQLRCELNHQYNIGRAQSEDLNSHQKPQINYNYRLSKTASLRRKNRYENYSTGFKINVCLQIEYNVHTDKVEVKCTQCY